MRSIRRFQREAENGLWFKQYIIKLRQLRVCSLNREVSRVLPRRGFLNTTNAYAVPSLRHYFRCHLNFFHRWLNLASCSENYDWTDSIIWRITEELVILICWRYNKALFFLALCVPQNRLSDLWRDSIRLGLYVSPVYRLCDCVVHLLQFFFVGEASCCLILWHQSWAADARFSIDCSNHICVF